MARPQSPRCQCGHSLGWHIVGCRRCTCPAFRVPDLMAALEESLRAVSSPSSDLPKETT